jgi:competence protein ComFC
LTRLLSRLAAGAGATVVSALFPSRCRVCQAWLETAGERVVCGGCLARLIPERSPACPSCGTFFAGAGGVHYCAACLETPPPFSRQRSFGRYAGVLKDLILLFKFQGYSLLAEILAERAFAALEKDEGVWGGAQALVPVPLHPRRQRERGFNQSALLARELARRSGVGLLEKALVRTRDAPPQSTLEAGERPGNVSGVFIVKRPERIRGGTIILVDDVCTTGSTLGECATALLEAGADEVRAITLARA